MANSKAKKKRLKQLRERGKDMTIQRIQVDFSTHVRMTKTKQEALNKLDKKHKRHFQDHHTDSSGNAFTFFYLTSLVRKILEDSPQSIQPNVTPHTTDVNAVESASAHVNKLV
ncbi:hypothetical protein [Ureibacillus sp. GCM10028918]|uniref:hypothetical protein n=1 Tax=Ureibacillus sp. GCM10028918 TaxID=3273429 RepID=UPI00361BB8CE